MVTLKSKQEIILGYFREGHSQRRISRDLGLNRKTVNRYVEDYKSKLECLSNTPSTSLLEEIMERPTYNSKNRNKCKLHSSLLFEVKSVLAKNEERRLSGQHKQQYKKVDIHEHLQELGYSIGYSTICKLVNELDDQSREAFIRQQYSKGDVCEFDWGEVKIDTSNGIETYQMAVFTSGYSNYRYACLFKKQDTSSFQQAHVYFFEKVDGVFKIMVYDNMKVAVKTFVGPTEKEATDGLLKLSIYYNFSFRFCNVRKGNEKGHVERSVELVRRKAFAFRDKFSSLAEANEYLSSVCDKLNRKPKKEFEGRSFMDLFDEEKPYLFLTKPAFECSEEVVAKVDKYSTISYKTSRYSVPDSYVGKMITARVYPDKVLLSYDDKLLCRHPRLTGVYDWSIKIEHYTKTLKRKPGALYGSVALAQVDVKLKEVYEEYFRKREKEFIELIEYMSKEDISSSKLESMIQYLKPRDMSDVTLDKIKILSERKSQEELTLHYPIENSEIDEMCCNQLSELSELFPDYSSLTFEVVEVL